MKKVGIIGLGLIGGSLAKALKRYKITENIAALDPDEASLKDAFDDGTIDEHSTDDYSIFRGCEIVFICVTVAKIPAAAERLRGIVDKSCIITDVGSTKLSICEKMREIPDVLFIGGHPMAGSEKSGYKHATDTMFHGAAYILTPDGIDTDKLTPLIKVIKKIGARPLMLPLNEHDKLAAAASHVPHVIAAALVNAVRGLDVEFDITKLFAGGFKDITRVASSRSDMWTNISLDNKVEVLNVLDDFKTQIALFEKFLTDNSAEKIHEFFAEAKEFRDGI